MKIKISEMPLVTSAIADDILPVVQSSNNKKIKVSDLLASASIGFGQVVEYQGNNYSHIFENTNNTEVRLVTDNTQPLNLVMYSDEEDIDQRYTSTLVFTTSDTAVTSLSYSSAPLINWIGSDCGLINILNASTGVYEKTSVFIPQPNTHYNITFSYDGTVIEAYVIGTLLPETN